MALVTTKEMFEKAYNGGYAVGAFLFSRGNPHFYSYYYIIDFLLFNKNIINVGIMAKTAYFASAK